jgi:hypothetical protein
MVQHLKRQMMNTNSMNGSESGNNRLNRHHSPDPENERFLDSLDLKRACERNLSTKWTSFGSWWGANSLAACEACADRMPHPLAAVASVALNIRCPFQPASTNLLCISTAAT